VKEIREAGLRLQALIETELPRNAPASNFLVKNKMRGLVRIITDEKITISAIRNLNFLIDELGTL
jgi:hypothetical protein